MKCIGWDVGVLTLSYCILEYNESEKEYNENENNKKNLIRGTNISVNKWGIINIINDEENDFKCKSKMKNGKICNKTAKYKSKLEKSEIECYCKTHLPKNTKDYAEIKKKNSKTTSIFEICQKLIDKLDNLPEILDVDEICIENQPKFNPKMKTIAAMVYSYYVIRGFKDLQIKRIKKIKYVAARSSLKYIPNYPDFRYIPIKSKNKYKIKKDKAIQFCKYLLEGNEKLEYLKDYKKQDDLSDSFLLIFSDMMTYKVKTKKKCLIKPDKIIKKINENEESEEETEIEGEEDFEEIEGDDLSNMMDQLSMKYP